MASAMTRIDVHSLVRGDSWSASWSVREPDGAELIADGAIARLHVRSSAGALLLSASTDNGHITLSNGAATLLVPFTATESLAPGRYAFDLEITRAGTRWTPVRGVLLVLPDYAHD